MNHTSEALAHTLLTDPLAYAQRLSRLRDAVLAGKPQTDAPRALISASWARSLSAHVDPEADGPPVVYDEDQLTGLRSHHPLAPCLPMLRQTLLTVADQALHVMIVTDADGTILWREGHAPVQLLADQVGLSPGTRWSEDAIGTNAMGTTLAVDRPVQVYSAEHLVRTYQTWTCAAAPVHDPDTGDLIGAIDVSGPLHTIHPSTVALVSAVARLAEAQLAAIRAGQDRLLLERHQPHLQRLHGQPGAIVTPHGRVLGAEPAHLPTRVDTTTEHITLDDGRTARLEPLDDGFLLRVDTTRRPPAPTPRLRLEFLGDKPALVTLDDRSIPLALRHAELLAALALHPNGLNAEQLALHLYGDRGNPITVRAEIHRLRAELGPQVIGAKPYRVLADLDGDFLTVARALRDGDVETAARHHRGTLLPRSDAPLIRRERDEQYATLRAAVLAQPHVDPLWLVAQSEPGRDDLHILETLSRRLPGEDQRRWWVLARLKTVYSDDE